MHEPMTDLVLLMSKLVAPDGTILVPGVDDMVSAANEEERYECVQFYNVSSFLIQSDIQCS